MSEDILYSEEIKMASWDRMLRRMLYDLIEEHPCAGGAYYAGPADWRAVLVDDTPENRTGDQADCNT
jgi:hypothetical protein